MTQQLLISAGEASGDLHAANLVRQLHQLKSDIKVTAMGGQHLRAAGAQVIVDCADLAVVGLLEVISHYPTIKGALKQMSTWLTANQPDLLILVDYQEFNLKLAQVAKGCGVKVLFYIGPQVWAWRPKRINKMRQYVDMMAVLFPFEEALYQAAKVPVEFVGHPLVDEVYANEDKSTLLKTYGLDDNSQIVGLFPGSRQGEIKRILPIQLAAAQYLQQHQPQLQFVLAVANTIGKDIIESYCIQYPDLPVKVVEDRPYNVMSVCDAIISASGTATLEIGLMGIPLVITYRISPVSYALLKPLVKIDHIGLVNIVAQAPIVREFIQAAAKPESIGAELLTILQDSDYRQQMIAELAQLKEKLGRTGGSNNVAALALSMLATS